MSRHQPSLDEYAREMRWAEQCRRWAMPVAGSLGVLAVALFLWALWTISDALL